MPPRPTGCVRRCPGRLLFRPLSEPEPGAGAAGPGRTWPDARAHRQAALALLESLRAALLSENSATLTLERWCAARRGAGDRPIRVVAEPDRALRRPLDAAGRAQLQLAPLEPVAYRHVRLSCCGHVLSEADNWYVPDRLTPSMNQRLATTDQPFGRVVQSLDFTRTTLSSRLLWSPLPDDIDPAPALSPEAGAALDIPQVLMENQAVLHRPDGRPFALLVESYRRGLLDFAAPLPG